MDENKRSLLQQLIHDLTQQRDELKLNMHLGSQDAKDQMEKMEEKLYQLKKRLEPVQQAAGESAEHIWEAVQLLAGEVKDGFDRIRKSL
jgi:uncharacterized membrane protein YukC